MPGGAASCGGLMREKPSLAFSRSARRGEAEVRRARRAASCVGLTREKPSPAPNIPVASAGEEVFADREDLGVGTPAPSPGYGSKRSHGWRSAADMQRTEARRAAVIVR